MRAKVSTAALLSILLLVTASPLQPAADGRPVSNDVLSGEGDDSLPNCWDSLVRLQACSGELILFFLNGEAYIGDGCCDAIRDIGKQCWPDLIRTLGFTSGEGDVLQGYCDGEAPGTVSRGSDHREMAAGGEEIPGSWKAN